jgi:hypothetical protein
MVLGYGPQGTFAAPMCDTHLEALRTEQTR